MSSLPPARAGTGALASLALAMLLSSLGTSVANVGLPTFVRAFDASFQSVQWVVLAYLLAVTALVVPAGRLGDLFGRRRLMLVGIATFTVASMACAAAPSLAWLVAARACQGFGAAMMMALTMALVGESVPKERSGRAMGLLGTMSAVGTALGPSAGGVLIAYAGWPAIFLINLPLGLLAAVLAWRFLPRGRPAAMASGIDLPGSFLLVCALASYALAMTLGRGQFGMLNLALAAAAVAIGAIFLTVESRTRAPLVRPALLRDRLVGGGFASSALATTVAMTTLVVGPFYLSGALHLDTAAIGLAMSVGPMVAALVGVPAGKAVDRYGAARMTVVGLLLMTAGTFALSRIGIGAGTAGYVAALATLTAGFATFQAANNTAVVTGTDAHQRGVVSGLLTLSRNLGLVTGASLMGAVFMHAAGVPDIESANAAAVVHGTRTAFLLASVLLAVALAFVVAPRLRIAALVLASVAAVLAALPAHAGEPGIEANAEARLRYVTAGDFEQTRFRGIVRAQWRPGPHVRLHGELGTGQVDRGRDTAGANFQNRASVQQLFVDLRGSAGAVDMGATIGRQEFADGPRQLLSASDGPNLHRSWNGVRLHAQGAHYRASAFDFRATRLGRGAFDDRIDAGTVLRGANASLGTWLDAFWLHTELPGFRFGDESGMDRRDTHGLRVRGRRGTARWDWTLARQGGRTLDGRRIDAWAVFAVQGLVLSDNGWKPTLTSHVDIASGGGIDGEGTLRNFHPLYASSNYLGESQFLGLSNLVLVAPGIALTPSANTTLAFEFAHARRREADDDAYAGGMRAHAGTAGAPGHHVGNLARLSGTWSPSTRLSFDFNFEHFDAGRVLRQAGSGSQLQLGATYRY